MADYTDSDRVLADRIVSHLLDSEAARLDLPAAELDLPQHMVISDVERHAQEFSMELDLLAQVGRDFPAMRLAGGDLVPVSLSSLFPGVWPVSAPSSMKFRPRKMHPFFREWVHYALRPSVEGTWSEFELESLPRGEARMTFARRAVDFLATRLSWVTRREPNTVEPRAGPQLSLVQRIGGPRVTTPGCLFTVSSSSSGLRVFWSGAYFISANYFNHPTTPASSVLQAGVYVFGVDGGAYGNHIQWDLGAVIALPGHPHVHLNY